MPLRKGTNRSELLSTFTHIPSMHCTTMLHSGIFPAKNDQPLSCRWPDVTAVEILLACFEHPLTSAVKEGSERPTTRQRAVYIHE